MNTFICPFTGLKAIETPQRSFDGRVDLFWYHVPYKNRKLNFRVCQSFFEELSNDQSEIRKRIEKSRGILLKEFLKDDFKIVRENILHWNCTSMAHVPKNFLFKSFLEELESKIPSIITRREKSESLVLYFYGRLKADDTSFLVEDDLSLWISLGFNSFDELKFYLDQLSERGLLKILQRNIGEIQFQFTLPGLEYCDQLLSKRSTLNVSEEEKYDKGFSFAGEKRENFINSGHRSRQLVAIMFTDIVGYTVLMGNDEQKAVEILRKNREIQKPIIEQFEGRWIKEVGDGVLASFTAVSDAVHAAIKIQEACNLSKEFSLRIGIDQGEVVFENADVFGDAVNIASRIQAIANPGTIYVSESVHNNIANKKEISTHFVRVENLKNVRDTIRIYEIDFTGNYQTGFNQLSQTLEIFKTAEKEQGIPKSSIQSRIPWGKIKIENTLNLYYDSLKKYLNGINNEADFKTFESKGGKYIIILLILIFFGFIIWIALNGSIAFPLGENFSSAFNPLIWRRS